jgi:hypothetical protein
MKRNILFVHIIDSNIHFIRGKTTEAARKLIREGKLKSSESSADLGQRTQRETSGQLGNQTYNKNQLA